MYILLKIILYFFITHHWFFKNFFYLCYILNENSKNIKTFYKVTPFKNKIFVIFNIQTDCHPTNQINCRLSSSLNDSVLFFFVVIMVMLYGRIPSIMAGFWIGPTPLDRTVGPWRPTSRPPCQISLLLPCMSHFLFLMATLLSHIWFLFIFLELETPPTVPRPKLFFFFCLFTSIFYLENIFNLNLVHLWCQRRSEVESR